MIKNEILLIGTGPMAIAYSRVFQGMNLTFSVVGRGEDSAKRFNEEIGVMPFVGGVRQYLKKSKPGINSFIFITTGTENLMPVLLDLLDCGVYNILIEKPAALSIEELLLNRKVLENYKGNIFVAYNRRFYASVLESEKLINEDGGLESMFFEFTEWAHKIEPLEKAHGVKENWFFANSTHVVDLAFHIAGKPENWHTYSKIGSLSWHNKTNFSGAGITKNGVIFSYLSNWECPGRWSIELLTKKRRIYLKPLEGVAVQNLGSVLVNEFKFDDHLDVKYKPGIYKQVEAFFNGNTSRLISIADHIVNSESIYYKIIS